LSSRAARATGSYRPESAPSVTIPCMSERIFRPRTRLVAGAIAALLLSFAFVVGTSPPIEARQADHAGQYAQADIEHGLRLYRSTCTTCHAESGDGVPGVNLGVTTPRAETDAELALIIRTGIEGTAMPPGEYSAPELTALVAYLRTMSSLDVSSVRLGEPTRGEAVVRGKGDCTSCHRLGDTGSLGLAPELSAIAATRTAGALERALLDPNSAMIPINRPVRAVLADGTVVNGRRLNEDTYTVQLIDESGRLRSLEKDALQEFTVIKESPMPSYDGTLTTGEIADVVAYLLTLRGVEGLD